MHTKTSIILALAYAIAVAHAPQIRAQTSASSGSAIQQAVQPGPNLPAVVASSDVQAQSALAAALQAAGGESALAAIQDFTATGTITYFWAGQQVQGSVTLRGKGLDEFRLDAVLPEGTRSWAVSHGTGNLKETDGTETAIPSHNALNLGALTFPYLSMAAAAANSTTTVSTIGTAQVGSVQALQIRVQPHYTSSFDPNGTIAQLTTKDFFIDPTSFLILKTEIMTHPLQTFTVSLPEDISFSNYQRVGGVIAPFTITETINGQEIWTIQLSSIQFNTGLNDADFSQ
ncbi:MAG: hypothetical protein ACRD1O_11450 [Terriglobia bacterium]